MSQQTSKQALTVAWVGKRVYSPNLQNQNRQNLDPSSPAHALRKSTFYSEKGALGMRLEK